MYFFPYMLFSFQTPNSSQTALSSSASSGKVKPYFATNLSWDATLSGDTPTISVPAFLNLACRSRKASLSVVQPEVLSLG